MNRSAQPSSPHFPLTTTPQRKVAIAVDLSDESAYAVRWAAEQYLRPGDSVVLLHVRPTSVLYGADWGWGSVDQGKKDSSHSSSEDELDAMTAARAAELARPLEEAGIEYKIHIVKDRDMKERLCLEVERLGLSAVIMGSRGVGASKRSPRMRRLGSVSDYCVHHCVCPVVVVRCPEHVGGGAFGGAAGGDSELHPVPEEEHECVDAVDDPKEIGC